MWAPGGVRPPVINQQTTQKSDLKQKPSFISLMNLSTEQT